MTSKSITMIDKLRVIEDRKAKTPSFYCLDKNILITKQTIKDLYAIHSERNFQPVRICLHKNPEELLHQMIIIMPKGYLVTPHKHLDKDECYHMIYGRMKVLVYENNGKIKETVILDLNNLVYKSGKRQFHAIVPLTKYVVYQEIKRGPFFRESDSIRPEWK